MITICAQMLIFLFCPSLVQYNLILKNTSKLMTNFSLRNWEALPSSSEVRLATLVRPKMDDHGTDRVVFSYTRSKMDDQIGWCDDRLTFDLFRPLG